MKLIRSIFPVLLLATIFAIARPARSQSQTWNPTNTLTATIVQKSVEFTRPANTTAYTAGDAVAPATKTITAASNATPIVITSTAHGYSTDDRVTIASVGGNTNANGTFKIVVQTANTFAIYNESTGAAIAGNSAYTSGGTAQKLLRLADVTPVAGGMVSLMSVRLVTDSATVTNGTFRVRVYNTPVAQIADNAAFTLLWANRTLQVVDVALPIIITEGSGSDASVVFQANSPSFPIFAAATRTDLFVQVTAIGAFTPTSGENFRLEFTFRRDVLRGNF